MKSRDRVTCPRCEGSGSMPLPHELAETLSFVRARGSATAPEVFRELMRSAGRASAANNRLEELRGFALIVRSGMRGRAYIYWAPTMSHRKKGSR